MKIRKDWHYYIDEYTTLKEFINTIFYEISNKEIKGVYSDSSNISSKKGYYTVYGKNYIVFEDNSVIKFEYNWIGIIDIWYTEVRCLDDSEIEIINNTEPLISFVGKNAKFYDYNVEKFSDQYIINPVDDTTRPTGGDYFKTIVLYITYGLKLCICAENAEFDGYCNIWLENDSQENTKGSKHLVWWEDKEDNKMISYYDLLTLMKFNQNPNKVKLTTPDGEGIFEWSEQYKTYYAVDSEKLLNTYGMNTYMFDNIYDNTAFDKCIEILEETNKDIIVPVLSKPNNDNETISYYDLLSLVKQGIIPKKVLVNSENYFAHYKYDEEGIYSIVFDELYDGESCTVHWEAFLNHELSYCAFEPCIKIIKE